MHCYIYGIGEVLSHVMDDHSDKPIAYASRSLSTVEHKYSQLDKEAYLAIIYVCCHLRFLCPNLDARAHQNQCRQKELHNFHARDHELVEGDFVLVKIFSADEPWLPGVKYYKTGPSSFTVDFTNGRRV